jgi:hypothetical protein
MQGVLSYMKIPEIKIPKELSFLEKYLNAISDFILWVLKSKSELAIRYIFTGCLMVLFSPIFIRLNDFVSFGIFGVFFYVGIWCFKQAEIEAKKEYDKKILPVHVENNAADGNEKNH